MRGFRIVVVAHGDLADALLASAALICGSIEDSRALGLGPAESPETYADRLRDAVGSGPSLVFADLAGGAPANVALAVTRDRDDAVVIAGVSLGMLIEAVTSLPALDGAAIDALVAAGRSGLARQDDRVRSSSPR